MSTVVDSGSQTATLTTEHDLGSPPLNNAGTYLLVIDAANLANGETLTLRAYRKARAADTQRIVFEAVFQHAVAAPILVSVPIPLPANGALKFTLRQDGGTGRAFPWSIETL